MPPKIELKYLLIWYQIHIGYFIISSFIGFLRMGRMWRKVNTKCSMKFLKRSLQGRYLKEQVLVIFFSPYCYDNFLCQEVKRHNNPTVDMNFVTVFYHLKSLMWSKMNLKMLCIPAFH